MKTVPVGKKVAIVDDCDFEMVVAAGPWRIWDYGRKSTNAYAIRHIKRNGKWTTQRMHRFIMGETPGDWDHINGDGLDNRRSNLRAATRSQNSANSRKPKITNARSRYKGVSRTLSTGKWTAQISVNRKMIYLGTFVTEEAAHAAYVSAAAQHFGEFARG